MPIWFLVGVAVVLRWGILPGLDNPEPVIKWLMVVVVFTLGAYLIRQTATIIADTTGVLKNRTGLAGGLLQALGTAFPDMVLGVVSAILSLQAAKTDPVRAINLAIVAASTTFGSNIYNILHASWCLYRQNRANRMKKAVLMFPGIKAGGQVIPLSQHTVKPPASAVDASLTILVFLSLLTTGVALGMVLFGKLTEVPAGIKGDMYQLTRGIGVVVLALSLGILYVFRHSHTISEETDQANRYAKVPTGRIWAEMLAAGVIILLAAESVIESVTIFSHLTGLPLVLTGVLTALVGCLGEMLVIHDFTIHPQGRIADAVTGVAMDNIVTTMGAAFIAILGGIFLGSDALIIIFVLILFANTTLMKEIATLKNYNRKR